MAKNTDRHKRASKKAKDGSEFGHMSEIEGIVADSAPNMTPTDALAILIAAWCIYHQVDALRQRATLKKNHPFNPR